MRSCGASSADRGNLGHAPFVKTRDVLDRDNRLFVLARQGQRQPSALVAIAVTFVTLAITVVGGQMVLRLLLQSMIPDETQSIVDPFVEGTRGLVSAAAGFLPVIAKMGSGFVMQGEVRAGTSLAARHHRRLIAFAQACKARKLSGEISGATVPARF